MGYELGLPTNFYHYTASFEKGMEFPSNGRNSVPNDHDNGVFVGGDSTVTSYAAYCPPSPYRVTSVMPQAWGCTNMETTTVTASAGLAKVIRMFVVGRSLEDGNGVYLKLGNGTTSEAPGNAYSTSTQLLSKFASGGMPTSNGTLTVHKTEVAYPFTWNDSTSESNIGECVYATGISAIMRYDDGTQQDQTIIIARVPSDGKDYPELYKAPSSDSWSTDGSIAFYSDGTIENNCVFSGDNLSGVTSTTISTAFPEAAMVANNGIIAVSCMVNADGVARWVGYKNGIYKLYNGSKPLYGTPGEKVTVKGHDFVCLAYSPFYARLS